MSVTSSTIIETGNSATFQAPRTDTYQVVWRVETDNVEDGPITVLQDGQTGPGALPHPLPVRYQTYNYFGEIDINALAMTHQVARAEDNTRKRWLVTVTYRQLQQGEDPNQDLKDPLARPTIWWVDFENTTEELYDAKLVTDLSPTLGASGAVGQVKPWVNAVNDQLALSVQVPKQYTIYTAQKNYASYQEIANIGTTYANKRNDDIWRGWPKGSVLFRSVDAGQPYYENGAEYYQAVFRFKIDTQDLHSFKLPHTGLRYTNVGNNISRLRDYDPDTKQKITQPVFLALNGTLVGDQVSTYIEYEQDNLIPFEGDLPE